MGTHALRTQDPAIHDGVVAGGHDRVASDGGTGGVPPGLHNSWAMRRR